jgi:branched-chain amino acid transport system substrate-binding protein
MERQQPKERKMDEKINGRRKFLKGVSAGATVVGAGLAFPSIVRGQGAKIRVGVMLPATGTFSQTGGACNLGLRLAFSELGGKVGGRDIEIFQVDDESDPAKATDNTNRLVTRDKVDVVIGTIHSGVAGAMIRVTRESGTLHLIPNAGLAQATGALCAPNIVRTSFSNWQTGYAMGAVMALRKNVKSVATISWRYAAGEEYVKGFKDGFLKGGGKIAKELWLPFPNVEFQALLTEIASLKPDATYAFFAGAGAGKFVKDYAQAGLRDKIPLVGPGFLTDGVLEAVGSFAQGIETTLHYADGLNTKKDNAFRLAYVKAYKLQPDVYSVQGYDTVMLLDAALKAVKGDIGNKQGIVAAMKQTTVDSPRGKWKLSRAHNPIQDIYLRKVVGTENRYQSVAVKAIDDDPEMVKLCKMA